jgi:hypothetical protein
MTWVEEPPLRDAAAVGEVVRRMHAVGADLPARDGVAVFNRVYLRVTRTLHERLRGGGFAAARASQELAVRFAGRYLDAVEGAEGGRRAPACWRPLFASRGHPAVRPLQFALAGVNAHIGHDLPLALVDTCRARGVEPALLEADFDRVGELLTALEEGVREDLMPGPDVLDVADPLTHLVGSWSLERARQAAWASFRALWGLRSLPGLAEEFTDRLDAGVGLVGRCLLTPLGCPDDD